MASLDLYAIYHHRGEGWGGYRYRQSGLPGECQIPKQRKQTPLFVSRFSVSRFSVRRFSVGKTGPARISARHGNREICSQ
jgi:hypothetical protein